MRTVEERNSILHRASELYKLFDFRALDQLLSPLAEAELLEEPDLAYWLAHAYYRMKKYAPAWKLTELLKECCLKRGRDRLYRRRLNLEGILLFERCEYASASMAFGTTLELATRSGDHWLIADATLNLGTVEWNHCRWNAALAAYQRSKTAYTLLGKTYSLAGCHQAIGMTYREMNFFDDADSHFEQAVLLYASSGSNRELELAAVECERAMLAFRRRDYEGAEVMVRRATERVASFEVIRPVAEALTVLGLVLSAKGQHDEAKQCLDDALHSARAEGLRFLEAEVYEAFANLARSQNEHAKAADWIGKAVACYREIGLKERAEKVHSRTARYKYS